MKLFIKLFLALFLSISFWQCQKQSELPVKTSGVSFNLAEEVSQLKSDVDVRAVIISVANKRGELIYDNKRLELYSMGGAYLTEQLTMEVGEYTLEQFSVVNSNNEIVYITPKQGSELEDLVRKALPIWFMVQENQATTVDVEVVSTDCDCPLEQFGYVSFSFTIVEEIPEIYCINIIVPEEALQGNYNLNITGENDLDTIINYLLPGINPLPFRNDSSSFYEFSFESETAHGNFVIDKNKIKYFSCSSDKPEAIEFIEIYPVDPEPVIVDFEMVAECGNCMPCIGCDGGPFSSCIQFPIDNVKFYLTPQLKEFDENQVIMQFTSNSDGFINGTLLEEPGLYTLWVETNAIVEKNSICGEIILNDKKYLKHDILIEFGINSQKITYNDGAAY